MNDKKVRLPRDKRTEEQKLEDYFRQRATVRGITVEQYKVLKPGEY